MITRQDLEETIAECKATRHPTAATVNLLAACYAVQDKLYPDSSPETVQPVALYSNAAPAGSEFVEAARAAGEQRTLAVLDEHMESIKILYPREYRAIMRKLRET